MIKTEQLLDGWWTAFTEESPFMKVEAMTEDEAIGIILKGLKWYEEGRARRALKEIESSEVVKLEQLPVHSDTAPSEIVFEDTNYMQGC